MLAINLMHLFSVYQEKCCYTSSAVFKYLRLKNCWLVSAALFELLIIFPVRVEFSWDSVKLSFSEFMSMCQDGICEQPESCSFWKLVWL